MISFKNFFKSLWAWIVAMFRINFNLGFRRYSSKTRLDGKTVIVTGATRGIGAYVAYDLAKRGAKVILACRNVEKAREIAADIITRTQNQQVIPIYLDLSSIASVRQFASEINATQNRLNILIHNAGVYGGTERNTTIDGFEENWQVNHLAPLLLTNLLLPLMKISKPGRIIFVSSSFHHTMFTMDLDNLNSEKSYRPDIAYARSKAANVMITKYLASELKGTGISVYSLCPGLVDTGMSRSHYLAQQYPLLSKYHFSLFALNPEDGAQTIIYCAVEPSLDKQSGRFYQFCKPVKSSLLTRDFALVKRVWDISEEMVRKAGLS